MANARGGKVVGGMKHHPVLVFERINFASVGSVTVACAAPKDATLVFRSQEGGDVIGHVDLPSTGDWKQFAEVEVTLQGPQAFGNLEVKVTGQVNLDWLFFAEK